jgi:N6-L-threonylcarbamoyladenine synthase
MKKIGQYRLLGRTHDDAVGEAFDKVAKILGLPYPGGPAIAAHAARGNDRAYAFPRAMLENNSLDFSYSGLKTSVLYTTEKMKRMTPRVLDDICASFQRAALDPLIAKTYVAAKQTKAKTVILAGGVAANSVLRHDLATMVMTRLPGVKFIPPVLPLCMDNGVMIAMAGIFHARQSDFIAWRNIKADPNWELV